MRITQAVASRIAETAASAIQAVATRPTNELSPTAVTGARPEIKSEVTEALVAASGTGAGGVALVETKSAWLSKINWTAGVTWLASLIVTFLLPKMVDIGLPEQVIALFTVQTVSSFLTGFLKTFFTSTVTESSVKS